MDRIIVLVGLMGSGKSRVGKELARLLGLPFADADQEIERAASYSITEIFERFGEAEFRRGEREVMQRLLRGHAKVLASGGGAFIQPDVRKMVKESAISVWLKADLKTLVDRTGRTNHRPLLRVADPGARLRQLMDQRYPIYAEADITVETDGQGPRETAERIRAEIERLQKQK